MKTVAKYTGAAIYRLRLARLHKAQIIKGFSVFALHP
jgi:hypothetical protein